MRKLLSKVNFKNGAKLRCFIHTKAPKKGDKSDLFEVEITPEGDERIGFFFNVYDMNNLIWLMSNAILHAHENDMLLKPEEMRKK